MATRTSRIACPPRPAWTLSATILHPEELEPEVPVAHGRPGDRQELELTARQGRAAGVPEGQELGERREDALDGPARGTPARDREVLEDREVREDPPPLRHEADPAPRDLLGRPARHVGGPVGDPPVARRDDAGNRRERGRLARAVPAEERDELSREDVERDAVQHVALAVEGVHRGDAEERRGRPARTDRKSTRLNSSHEWIS